MSEEIHISDLDIDEFKFDVNKLTFVVWDKYEIVEGCPVCDLSEESLTEIHNDCLNYGYLSKTFKGIWEGEFAPEVIRSHFVHHCVASQLVKWFQKEKRKLDKDRRSLDNSKAVISQQEQTQIDKALVGDFSNLYSEGIRVLYQQLKFAEQKQKGTSEDVAGEQYDPEEEHRWHMKAVAASEKILKSSLEMDKLYHAKTYQAIRTYMSHMRMNLVQKMVDRMGILLSEIQSEMSGKYGPDAISDFMEHKVDSFRQDVQILCQDFETRSLEQIADNKD